MEDINLAAEAKRLIAAHGNKAEQLTSLTSDKPHACQLSARGFLVSMQTSFPVQVTNKNHSPIRDF